jgi:hypothetical protein
MVLFLLALIVLFFIIKNDKSNDVKRYDPCSRYHKGTDEYRKQGDDKEHPVVHVARMVCKLLITLFKYYLIFLFLAVSSFLLFLIKFKL